MNNILIIDYIQKCFKKKKKKPKLICSESSVSPKQCNLLIFIIIHFKIQLTHQNYVIIIENSPRERDGFLSRYEVWNAKTFHENFLVLFFFICFILGGGRHKIRVKIYICPYFQQKWITWDKRNKPYVGKVTFFKSQLGKVILS